MLLPSGNTALAPDTLDDNHDDTSSKTDGPRMKRHGTVSPLSQASCVGFGLGYEVKGGQRAYTSHESNLPRKKVFLTFFAELANLANNQATRRRSRIGRCRIRDLWNCR